MGQKLAICTQKKWFSIKLALQLSVLAMLAVGVLAYMVMKEIGLH